MFVLQLMQEHATVEVCLGCIDMHMKMAFQMKHATITKLRTKVALRSINVGHVSLLVNAMLYRTTPYGKQESMVSQLFQFGCSCAKNSRNTKMSQILSH